jgi:hypothetical protein
VVLKGSHCIGFVYSELCATTRDHITIVCMVCAAGACHKPGQRCLVTEYCARGSLDQVLHKSGACSTQVGACVFVRLLCACIGLMLHAACCMLVMNLPRALIMPA